MSHSVTRALVDEFYKVYATRDAGKIAPFIHDDVEWTISGPIDFLPFCGVHRGKADVLDMIQNKVQAVIKTFSFVPESIVIDGDQVAMLSRQAATRTKDGCIVRYRVANIMRFCDGQVIENLSLLDSFDAVEQVLGQQLAAGGGVRTGDERFVTV
jgi:ketosteroid isomerase-like protein